MKNITLFFFLILFFISSVSFAQYYVKLEGGYNLSLNSMTIAFNSTITPPTITHESVNGSFGKGINFTGAFGYTFSSNVGLELGLIYKLSTEFEGSNQESPPPYNNNVTWNGSFFGFAPTFVVNAPMNQNKSFRQTWIINSTTRFRN